MTTPSHRPPLDSSPQPAPASPLPRTETQNDGEYVVVDLEEDSTSTSNCNSTSPGEPSSDLAPNKKYSSPGADVELGCRPEGKHVSHSSKDDAADGETVCRVCHLGLNSGSSESIVLGCACKQDLALCHRDCAEEWFKIRGNTVCEICGETAKNVHILEPAERSGNGGVSRLEASGEGGSAASGGGGNSQASSATALTRLRYLWANQLIRNSLLATMIVVFMVPWFFRIAYF